MGLEVLKLQGEEHCWAPGADCSFLGLVLYTDPFGASTVHLLFQNLRGKLESGDFCPLMARTSQHCGMGEK